MAVKILLANPRGFCAGVERAIAIVERCLGLYGAPVYVRHHIVHNEHVVAALEKKGAVFVEDLADIPSGAAVVLSAHGSDPAILEEARARTLNVIDAVCPLVIKVHFEAMRYHRHGYTIIYIGHRGHQEAIGALGHAPMHLVESVADVEQLAIGTPEKLAYLTQTTLSLDDTAQIITALKAKYPQIKDPPKEDICYATTNRQYAVKALAQQADLILVIGSPSSSNSKRLVETARYAGASSHLVPSPEHIDVSWFSGVRVIGITSGASAPDDLVTESIAAIKEKLGDLPVENLQYKKEEVTFRLPPELQ